VEVFVNRDPAPFNVLFLCTGNSARSILAEQLLNHWGHGAFSGYSAGSHPRGAVHPIAIALLEHMKLPTAGLRSKSWDEFAEPAAVEGPDARRWLAFRQAFRELENRIKIFTSLPIRSLDRLKLQERLDAIGRARPGEID
jgi:arsenate reductase